MYKILYHHRIASQDGQFVHLSAILEQLEKQGHEVVLIGPTIHPEKPKDTQEEQSLVSRLKSRLPSSVYELMELAYGAVVAFRLFMAIKKHKPDFIYERYNAYQPVGVWLAKKMNLPVILEVNAPIVDERRKYSGLSLYKIAKSIENWTWKNASAVLPVTDVLANYIRAANVPEHKIHVIHNGVHREWASSLTLKKLPKNPSDPIVIGFVGYMQLTSGVAWAVECLQSLPSNVELVCIGDAHPDLKSYAKSLNLMHRIRFMGLLNREQALMEVAKFDIALQPDVTPYASPLKMFEYMACRTLIVAPSTPNIREILDETCAVFFNLGDKESFQNALISASKNVMLMNGLREGALQQMDKKNFYWDDNAVKIIRIAEQQMSFKQ